MRLSGAVALIIKSHTEESFMTQSELARRSGVSQPHISNVFNERSTFSLDQLDAICIALGLQVASVIHEAEQRRRL